MRDDVIMPELILIRGLPGSGKSTLAKKFIGYEHLETDEFFINHEGKYIFDKTQLSKAHKWCFKTAKIFLEMKKNVVVSNTFSMIWEMQPYLDIPNCTKTIITCEGNYGNIHNVPVDVVEKMKQRWERY